jgi:hypothetical protein
MSDLNDLIHTNATIAFNQGVDRERERIIKLLEPLAEHDEDLCYDDAILVCWEDCEAPSYQDAIGLIKGEQK